jgi:hypothetical protein
MPYLVNVEIWGPETGCELELDGRASEARDAVRACARRGLQARLPEASVTDVVVGRQERWWDGRMRPGYRVAVTISAPRAPERDRQPDERRLPIWVESDVCAALLELINPLSVERVSVTPAAES